MASFDLSNLKDLLSPQLDSNPILFTKPMKPLTTPLVIAGTKNLEEDSLGGNSYSSTLSSPASPSCPSSPSLQFSMSIPSSIDMSLNLGKKKEKLEIMKDNGSYLEKNLGKQIKYNKNKEFTAAKCIPPPISCLKKVNVGKPYKYLAYDKESDNSIVKEIKIPEGRLFHALREDGRLKLFANFLHEDESQ